MFGLELESNAGRRLLMSEAAHLNFIGKAGSATTKIYLKDFATLFDTPSGPLSITYPDEVRWFDLQIAAEEQPLCFVYHGSDSTDYASGITHIYKIKTGLYGIGIQQTYATGSPLSGDGVDVYCFTRPRGFSSDDGFEMRDRNGDVTFHSDMKFLSVKGFASVPHWSSYAGTTYSHGITGLSKPAMPCFSNIAALSVTTTQSTSGGGCTTRYVISCDVFGSCTGSTVYNCNYTWSSVKTHQMFRHIIGVNSTGIQQYFAGYPIDVNDSGSDGFAYPSFAGTVLPVIDGADYD